MNDTNQVGLADMTVFELTDQDAAALKAGDGSLDVWKGIADRMGFDINTVSPADPNNEKLFFAMATTPKNQA